MEVSLLRILSQGAIAALTQFCTALHVCHYDIDQTWCDYTHTHSMFSNCQHGRHGGGENCSFCRNAKACNHESVVELSILFDIYQFQSALVSRYAVFQFGAQSEPQQNLTKVENTFLPICKNLYWNLVLWILFCPINVSVM